MSNLIFFQDVWRMDWGLGNPNKTAALIAILMVAVWAIGYVRRWGFWLALILFTGLGVCLIHTFSRGGLVAAIAGLSILLWRLPRPWPLRRSAAIVASIWVIVAVSIYLDAYVRYGQGLLWEDRSIGNRIELWKAGLRMMADAADGWGVGNSGLAYMQWYQPLDRGEEYRTMVNSHLTWLVEFGWPVRFLYLLGWFLIFSLCWPSNKARWLAIPLSVWVVFSIAALFSSVAESLWLWIVPASSLCVVVTYRIIHRDFPPSLGFILPVVAAAFAWIVMGTAGTYNSNILGSADRVVIGEGRAQIWLVVDERTMGKHYGKTLRRYLEQRDDAICVGVVDAVRALPDVTGCTVVVPGNCRGDGQLAGISRKAAKVIFLAPAFYPTEAGITGNDFERVEAIFGEFSESPSVSAWQDAAPVKRIAGTGDFFPRWPESIFSR